MSDPKDQHADPGEAAPSGPPLDETTPPIDQQQRGGEIPGFEPLDKTTAEVREFLGSAGVPERRVRRDD
jgi:hypothetical protein